MRLRDLPTAEVIDDSEELSDRIITLVASLLELEKEPALAKTWDDLTEILDEDA